MDERSFFLVVYDISDDRRRTRLHNRLLDYGSPVQYSVFECLLTKEEYQEMRKAVRRVIRPRLDQVRFYAICKSCLKKAVVTSGKEVLTESPRPVVV
jgi:CRISPR-associated protein Cas2